jgi:hypothetical protein
MLVRVGTAALGRPAEQCSAAFPAEGWNLRSYRRKKRRVKRGTGIAIGDDGQSLLPYTGSDAGQITVGGELNKLANNVALGRDMAGVHWRSDAEQALLLGEKVTISILRDQQYPVRRGCQFSRTNQWHISRSLYRTRMRKSGDRMQIGKSNLTSRKAFL